ncbi:3D-(3,5/4)-trihydroxycyclohexane-1,2-dione hydrolase [Planifilum fimeticola]|uniref:3D-(3,5/4)-trihydroxycyclohexane-1,2-dione hydrolase n=1 Tax=Planifilum fimeticola TaxID=201975 RepID=A0A2T0LCA0_9BACL|nr:3D-(3,5/4)-trihydroxycyclohexane-1,2-dione acylhydrolase (decyclizing) [Planifilum fimeticola]PRX39581.1 3D-(3,5/4)-trihydroxycyclohexane-1,2-dione hydrolase [Planifilum fimeticola]
MKLTTAQALVKFLNSQYVEVDGKEQKLFKGIFTIFGHGNVLGIGQALEQDPGDLEVYQGRNEQGMAHAAIGFAKQNRRRQLIACTSSVGPGAANMVTAAATATANNIPLLLLPGDTFATRQPDPVLQQIEQPHDASLSTNDAFRPVSKYWDRVNRPEQLMSAMMNAVRVLTDPAETGAVTIALPQDVQAEAYDYPESFFKKRVHRFARRRPVAFELEQVAALFKKSKKPLIICGGGVRYSEAADALDRFVRMFHIPFAETQAGKSALPSTHPLNLGGIGVTGNAAANRIAKEADLVIGVGTRFTDFTTASKRLFQNKNVAFVTINISDFHASKLDATKIVADARAGLEDLQVELEKMGYRSGYVDEIERARQDWQRELQRLYQTNFRAEGYKPEISGHMDEKLPEYARTFNSCLTQTGVLGKVNELIDDDAIVVGASGSLPGDMQRMWISTRPDTYHMEYGYSCMGYEIAAALGVKIARPDQEVYALVGDGSYMMLHSELITSIQEGLKINVILFDNAGFGCINNLQMSNGMGSFATEFRLRDKKTGRLDGPIMQVDFAQNAAAYGAATYMVRTMEELELALEDAKRQTVSTLIDVKVLPKTMTDGYDSWWHVGVAEVSEKEAIRSAYRERMKQLEKARKY